MGIADYFDHLKFILFEETFKVCIVDYVKLMKQLVTLHPNTDDTVIQMQELYCLLQILHNYKIVEGATVFTNNPAENYVNTIQHTTIEVEKDLRRRISQYTPNTHTWKDIMLEEDIQPKIIEHVDRLGVGMTCQEREDMIMRLIKTGGTIRSFCPYVPAPPEKPGVLDELKDSIMLFALNRTPGLDAGPQPISRMFVVHSAWAYMNNQKQASNRNTLGRALILLGLKSTKVRGNLYYDLTSLTCLASSN